MPLTKTDALISAVECVEGRLPVIGMSTLEKAFEDDPSSDDVLTDSGLGWTKPRRDNVYQRYAQSTERVVRSGPPQCDWRA